MARSLRQVLPAGLRRRRPRHPSMEDEFVAKSTRSEAYKSSRVRDADDLSFSENLRLAWGNLVLAVRYVMYSIRRDRRSFYVGVWTVAIVVGFVSVLASAVQNSPAIFLAIAEDEGECGHWRCGHFPR